MDLIQRLSLVWIITGLTMMVHEDTYWLMLFWGAFYLAGVVVFVFKEQDKR